MTGSRITRHRRIALVTGASSGLGLSVAMHLARSGWKVWAGVRRPESFDEVRDAVALQGIDPQRVVAVDLDVTSTDRIGAAVAKIVEVEGRGPDLLVANAGLGAAGFVEEMGLETWRRIIDTNLLGVIDCTRIVLPGMRERGRGHVVIIGSNAANLPQPAFAPYAATKWAVEGFAETLALEVAPFGVDVTVVQPGALRTGFADRTSYELPEGPYTAFMEPLSGGWDALASNAIDSDEVARAIVKLVDKSRPPLRLRVGRDARRWGVWRHILPGRVRMGIARRFYRLPKRGAASRARTSDVPDPQA